MIRQLCASMAMRATASLLALTGQVAAAADIADRVATARSALTSKEASSYYFGSLGPAIADAMRICAPPGSNVAPQGTALTLVGNMSAQGRLQEVEVEPRNDLTRCLAAQLEQASLPKPPASILGAQGFPIQIELVVDNGQDKPRSSVAVTPVFSQLVAFAVPHGFRSAFENRSATNYIQELLPVGEVIDHWSQMITLTGAKGASTQPQASPATFLQRIAAGFQRHCPSTFIARPLGKVDVGGYEGFVALTGCGTVLSGAPRSEVNLLVGIMGRADIYTLQWAARSTPNDQPPVLDEEEWKGRFQQLLPIRICDIVPAEAPPYPSCVHGSAASQP